MEIPVLVWSLKSSILRLTSSQMDQNFWGVVSAVEGRLRLWGVHWDILFHWPIAYGSPFGVTFQREEKIAQTEVLNIFFAWLRWCQLAQSWWQFRANRGATDKSIPVVYIRKDTDAVHKSDVSLVLGQIQCLWSAIPPQGCNLSLWWVWRIRCGNKSVPVRGL